MSDVVSYTEIDSQHVELLPGRTMVQTNGTDALDSGVDFRTNLADVGTNLINPALDVATGLAGSGDFTSTLVPVARR